MNLLESFLRFLEGRRVVYCVIGGQAVNAYVEPLVSLDLDVAVAVEDIDAFAASLASAFPVSRHPHSLTVSVPGSDLQVRVQTDPRYSAFATNGESHEVLGRTMRVARLEDVLQGKVWAASDRQRRASKRQKDLADISRLIEAYPQLRSSVPEDLLSRLL